MDENEYNSADIVKRLRAWSQVKTGEFPFGLMDWASHCTKIINDAAREIERLRGLYYGSADIKCDDDKIIERYAIAMALGNNGGEWASHYTDEQKEVWRRRAKSMLEDIIRDYGIKDRSIV